MLRMTLQMYSSKPTGKSSEIIEDSSQISMMSSKYDPFTQRIISLPEEPAKNELTSVAEQLKSVTQNGTLPPSASGTNMGAPQHHGTISNSRHLNGHSHAAEAANTIVAVPHSRTTRSKPAAHLALPNPP